MIEFYEYEVYILYNQEWVTRLYNTKTKGDKEHWKTLKKAILEHERGNSTLLLDL